MLLLLLPSSSPLQEEYEREEAAHGHEVSKFRAFRGSFSNKRQRADDHHQKNRRSPGNVKGEKDNPDKHNKKDTENSIYDIMQKIIDERNELNKKEETTNVCNYWDLLKELPDNMTEVGGPIDQFIATIPEEIRPTYILIEIPGQNNIQPIRERVELAKFFIHRILENYEKFI